MFTTTVYIDNLRKYKKRGHRWAHLFAFDIENLHNFAWYAGLEKTRYHKHPWPHYDIPEMLYKEMLNYGAKKATKEDIKRISKHFRNLT